MSILVIQLGPRPRLRVRGAAVAGPAAGDVLSQRGDYAYALSADGLGVASHGVSPAALLPRADTVVLVVADADIAWHRIMLPRAPAARLRAALASMLEDALLDEPEQVHLAVAPAAVAGTATWVAVVQRAWLQDELAALDAAQVFVDRIVPASWPEEPPSGHFFHAADAVGEAQSALRLVWSHADGVAVLPVHGGLARSLLAGGTDGDGMALPIDAHWTATPDAAAAAERWLDAPVTAMTSAERALQASRSLWNLRQFDLARRSRGTRALGDTVRGLLSPAWRPARLGLAVLAATQLIGVNLWAWRLDATLQERRAEQVALLQRTHPQVRAVLDAPLQMAREATALRSAAGKPDDGDLEPLLAAAATAWPPDRPPVESLRYEPGRLTLAAAGWDAAQVERFRSLLRPTGVRVESDADRLVLSRPMAGTGS